MAPHIASLINALTLIICAIWAYVAIGGSSITALIPAGFGVVLLACLPGVRAQNKVIAHVAVLLTFVVLVALYMPLSSALESGEPGPLLRVMLMIGTCIYAMVAFIKSFRDARRARG
ncbi:MAG: hypothetical protein AAF744_11580 [Pseudomonadota bacterium]